MPGGQTYQMNQFVIAAHLWQKKMYEKIIQNTRNREPSIKLSTYKQHQNAFLSDLTEGHINNNFL